MHVHLEADWSRQRPLLETKLVSLAKCAGTWPDDWHTRHANSCSARRWRGRSWHSGVVLSICLWSDVDNTYKGLRVILLNEGGMVSVMFAVFRSTSQLMVTNRVERWHQMMPAALSVALHLQDAVVMATVYCPPQLMVTVTLGCRRHSVMRPQHRALQRWRLSWLSCGNNWLSLSWSRNVPLTPVNLHWIPCTCSLHFS